MVVPRRNSRLFNLHHAYSDGLKLFEAACSLDLEGIAEAKAINPSRSPTGHPTGKLVMFHPARHARDKKARRGDRVKFIASVPRL